MSFVVLLLRHCSVVWEVGLQVFVEWVVLTRFVVVQLGEMRKIDFWDYLGNLLNHFVQGILINRFWSVSKRSFIAFVLLWSHVDLDDLFVKVCNLN